MRPRDAIMVAEHQIRTASARAALSAAFSITKVSASNIVPAITNIK